MVNITLQGEFTDLNKYIDAERSNRFIGASIKKQNTNDALKQLTKKNCITEYPVRIGFLWITKDIMVDPDNIAFAKKYILDALVTKGILKGDGRKQILGFTDDFSVDKNNPRVEITIL